MKTKYLILIFAALIALQSNLGATKTATVTIQKNEQKSGIRRELYGSFLEFLNHFVNSKYGFWAQEIVNRGFDRPAEDGSPGISKYWNAIPDQSAGSFDLVAGGYNKNGVYSQKISKSDNEPGRIGISQILLINGEVEQNCYFYFRSAEAGIKVKIWFTDTNFIENYYEAETEVCSIEWKKYSFTVPVIHKSNIRICLSIEQAGSVEIDEISMMPADNVGGVRKEIFDHYASWRPGILRYPGGCFADLDIAHWKDGIGDIDQRKSPKVSAKDYDQRLDFGTDEFLHFCSAIGTEPHIVVNLIDGTPEEAAQWVEYCNGSSDTPMGKLRAQNGRLTPYNVRYWELGNEQWSDTKWTANRSVLYNEQMKRVDPGILTIVDGNIWAWYWGVADMMPIVYGKCNIYAWHDTQNYCYDPAITREENYYSFMGASIVREKDIKDVISWLKSINCYEGTQIGVSELWQHYFHYQTDWTDTVLQAYSLESALWTASVFTKYQKYPECFVLGERTHGLGLLRGGIDTITGKRSFYPSPAYWALNMLANHSGNVYITSTTEGESFSVEDKSCLKTVTDAMFIDAGITATKDTMFVSVVNKHATDSVTVSFNFADCVLGASTTLYELNSENYTDWNSPENPHKVEPKQITVPTFSTLKFPPHSFSILAIPCANLVSAPDDLGSLDFQIAPNPFAEQLTISLPSEYGNTISVYDELGHIVCEKTVAAGNNNQKLNTDNWHDGVYIVRICNGKEFKTMKCVRISK